MKRGNLRDVKLGVQLDVEEGIYSLVIYKAEVVCEEKKRDDYEIEKWQAEIISDFLNREIERVYPRDNII